MWRLILRRGGQEEEDTGLGRVQSVWDVVGHLKKLRARVKTMLLLIESQEAGGGGQTSQQRNAFSGFPFRSAGRLHITDASHM